MWFKRIYHTGKRSRIWINKWKENKEVIIIEKIVRIDDIREATHDANLDTEYREAMAHSLMALGYVNDSPLNLSFGTPKQQKEIRKIEERPLDSNQISEIIHLMMYQMRNDFQYGKFKPVALKFLSISENMRSTLQNKQDAKRKEKLKCNIYSTFGNMIRIIGLASKTLKKNNMIDESREMIERATKSYSYDEALDIINEYVETIERSEEQEEVEEFE